MKKILYIILDGVGDRPIPELGNKTPLEAANTPNMDALAKKGKQGLMYTVGKNIAPESDVAVICLLGYDAHKYYTGRGPLESFAEELDIKDGDAAFRVNFATIDDKGTIIDRRVGRNLSTEEAASLSEEINKKVKLKDADFIFKNTIGHRGVLVIKSKKSKLSGMVTNTDPAYAKEGVFGVAKEKFENYVLKCEPVPEEKNSKEAIETANLVNEFVEKSTAVLNAAETNKKRKQEGKLVGNVILLRDAGDRLPKFPKMEKLYGMKFASLVEMPVEKGIALLTGMDIIQIPLPTGDPLKDYPPRAKRACQEIKKYDCLYVHLKGPDEPAHDGNCKKKLESIEAIDKYFFTDLLKGIDLKDTIICVTADHSTPCKIKAHSADPVPLLVCGVDSDDTKDFSERSGKDGSIGQILGMNLLPMLVNLAKRNE